MKVLAITGLAGSGKTTAIDAIKDMGLVIIMGDIVREEAKKRNLKYTANNLGKIAKELRKKEGPDIIAQKCIDLIKNQNQEVIIIDGIRSIFEVNAFRKYWKFPIISIVADEKLRLKRLFERSRSDDPKSIEEIKERDNREVKFGLKEVLKVADYRILNNSTIADLKKNTKELVQNIINNY